MVSMERERPSGKKGSMRHADDPTVCGKYRT